MGTVEEDAVFFDVLVYGDDVCAGEELHDGARGDDWRDAELHECSAVGGEDGTHPVERVRGARRHDAKEGHLGADQEDEERDCGPKDFFAELDLFAKCSALLGVYLAVGSIHLG